MKIRAKFGEESIILRTDTIPPKGSVIKYHCYIDGKYKEVKLLVDSICYECSDDMTEDYDYPRSDIKVTEIVLNCREY